jgi:hypothetical protein
VTDGADDKRKCAQVLVAACTLKMKV